MTSIYRQENCNVVEEYRALRARHRLDGLAICLRRHSETRWRKDVVQRTTSWATSRGNNQTLIVALFRMPAAWRK